MVNTMPVVAGGNAAPRPAALTPGKARAASIKRCATASRAGGDSRLSPTGTGIAATPSGRSSPTSVADSASIVRPSSSAPLTRTTAVASCVATSTARNRAPLREPAASRGRSVAARFICRIARRGAVPQAAATTKVRASAPTTTAATGVEVAAAGRPAAVVSCSRVVAPWASQAPPAAPARVRPITSRKATRTRERRSAPSASLTENSR